MKIGKRYAEQILEYELFCIEKQEFPGRYEARTAMLCEIIREFPEIASKQKFSRVPIVRRFLK